MKKNLLLGFLVLFLLTTFGCKVRYTLTGASVGSAKTFSVDYFQNMAELVYGPLSQDFITALKERFIKDTDLSLVREDGDLHFEGEITTYTNEAVTVTADEQAGAFRLTIGIRVKFTNVTDHQFEFDKTFTRFRDYTGGDLSSVEASLVNEMIEEIVDDIFKESVVNW